VLPEWERLFLVGGLTVATTGLCLSVVAFLASISGHRWITPEVSRILGLGAWILFILAVLATGSFRKPVKAPQWMSFVGHALFYFAVLSLLFFPANQRRDKASGPSPRELSYQMFFYFSAVEVLYVRFEHESQEGLSLAETRGNAPVG
jgi:hypothetical protein